MTKHTPTLILLHGGFQINDNCIETEHAAFIVRACNAHDDLVHAAQWALDHYNGKHMGANTITLLEKALAKAKGE